MSSYAFLASVQRLGGGSLFLNTPYSYPSIPLPCNISHLERKYGWNREQERTDGNAGLGVTRTRDALIPFERGSLHYKFGSTHNFNFPFNFDHNSHLLSQRCLSSSPVILPKIRTLPAMGKVKPRRRRGHRSRISHRLR